MSPTKPPAKPPNRPGPSRPKQRQSLTRPKRRMTAATWTWAGVIVVVAIVLVVVLVDTLSGSTKEQSQFGFFTPAELTEMTSIPASVFNQIGIDSSVAKVGGFGTDPGQPALTFPDGSASSPGVLYFGAEYCPYCAATRWAIVAALSRFGTFSGLEKMESSSSDVDPDTNTLTFRYATYTSKYLVFKPFEVQDRNHDTIPSQQPPRSLLNTIEHYNPDESFPFLDIGNKVFLVGSPYDPKVLANESWATIAGGLDDPGNYGTQAIVATANYISAGICEITHDQPASVCNSPGVTAAKTALQHAAS